MKFKYTALGASNQKLVGVLDAESLDAAREQLHKMGMSVVAINEVSEEEAAKVETKESVAEKKQEGITTFYFVSKDLQGKEVNGTIDSKDPNMAFRRLLTEYQFDVVDLYPEGAPDPAAASLKPQFEEWKKEMEEEGYDLSHKKTAGTKGELEEGEGEVVNEEIIAEMDQFIINTKKILSDHKDRYSDPLIREIEKTLGELERVRASNNLKHITKICNTLYELISNPDQAETAETATGTVKEDYDKTMQALSGNGFITNSFQFLELHNIQKKLARFEKFQTVLAKAQKVFRRSKAEEIDKNLANRIKRRRSKWFSKIRRKLAKKEAASPGLFLVISKFFGFLAAPNIIMRRARKQDMTKAFKSWREGRKQKKTAKKTKPAPGQAPTEEALPAEEIEESKRDYSGFFMELDSFVGWLLLFYIGYFFLVSFSLEKNIGLPKEFILRTVGSPLIINISIFLIVAHLTFTLKLRFFRSNFLGSVFLFFFMFGIYTILIANF